jgi:hypothetical protein
MLSSSIAWLRLIARSSRLVTCPEEQSFALIMFLVTLPSTRDNLE